MSETSIDIGHTVNSVKVKLHVTTTWLELAYTPLVYVVGCTGIEWLESPLWL
jgi:hypothetical protein